MNSTNLNFNSVQLLLDKISVIDFKYKKTRQKASFNIFGLLAKKFDEVHLHSKFIYELLNPKGSHGYQSVFLNLLLKQLQIDSFNTDNVNVYKEYKNIDILIRSNHQAIVIENKLYAGDQWNQLQRYHEILKTEGIDDIRIIYLTIDGKEPASHSIGNLVKLPDWPSIFMLISYEFEIASWIESCIKEAYDLPTLRETLIQYKSLINNICGKTMNNDETNEIIALIAEGDNVLKAKKIAENWRHLRWRTEWDFWNDLENVIEKNYKISDRNKFTSDRLNGVINQSRNRSPWYGLMFKINDYKKADAYLYVERGWDNVYYGITMIKDDNREINQEAKFNELAKRIKEISEWGQESYWIGGNYCQPQIDFTAFSNNTTLKLLNNDFRKNYVADLWIKIKQYVLDANAVIDEFK